MKTSMIEIVAFVLVLVGAVNWGLVGLFQFDLVAAIFGNMSIFSRLVYGLVGASAIYSAATVLPKSVKS